MWFSYVSKWLWNIHHHQNAEKKFFQKQIWFRNGASITAWNTSRYPPFTVFENYPKYRIWIWILAFSSDLTCLVTFFDRKLQFFQNSPKLTIFDIFYELFSTQNVNVARFAHNVKCDFFCDFQTLWVDDALGNFSNIKSTQVKKTLLKGRSRMVLTQHLSLVKFIS